MKTRTHGFIFALPLLAALVGAAIPAPRQAAPADVAVSRADIGRPGGQLVIALRAEPRTLNPVTALDSPSREVIRRTIADLIHINRDTQQTEPALAKSWKVSKDGRRYTLSLRRGIRFSDGEPFGADDVVFSFQVYLDEKVASTNRDFLIVEGEPIAVRKIDQYTVEFTLARPYAAAERLFDSIAILPRHLLAGAYKEGRLAASWGLNTQAAAMAGLGPFRFKEHVPGQRIVLERNPFYWRVDRKGNRLPYLDRLVFLVVPSEDAQVLRFQSGEADIVTRISAANFDVLSRTQRTSKYELFDLGASLNYTFLFFNQTNVDRRGLVEVARKQAWFRRQPFREAVSLAIDRDAIVRLVYRGRATPLAGHVPPGNKLWVNRSLPRPERSVERARQLLRRSGFSWTQDGTLVDEKSQAVDFTIVTNTGNAERMQIATMIQDDLKALGMRVRVATLELRALLDRILTTYEYDACVLGLGGGDADPNAELNVWLSSGSQHLWSMAQSRPATAWEAEVDRLMRQQVSELDRGARKRLYDRVQELVLANLPIVALVSPNILVGARQGLGNFHPTTLEHHALWNADELFWREGRTGATR